MAFSHTWGGAPNNTNGYVQGSVLLEQHGIAMPSGNLDLSNTKRPIRISGIFADYLSGGSGVTTAIKYGSTITNGQLFADSGGVFSFRVGSGSGTLYYGRNTAYDWSIYANGGLLGQRGALCGGFSWSSVPGKVRNFAAVRTGNSVRITFDGPSSNGGDAIDDYTIQYTRRDANGNWSGWMGSASDVDGDHTFSGLLPGYTYVFRVYANNSNGSGQEVQSSQLFIPPKGKRYDDVAESWVDLSTGRRMTSSTAYEELTIGRRFDGASWVDLTT